MNLLAIVLMLGFGTYCVFHMVSVKRKLVTEARKQLKANLQKRFDLVDNMFSIVKVHVPEYGAMLETLINLRLDAAKKTDEETSDEMKQEIFQMLYDLINVPSYKSENDEEIRKEFNFQLMLIESNISSAHAHYLSMLKSYTRISNKLNLPRLKTYPIPMIKAASEEKKKTVLTLLDSMVG